MRPVAREVAFEQGEFAHRERRRREVGVAPLEGCDGFGVAAVPAGQGDVRVEGAALGLDAGADAGAVDLARRASATGVSRLHPGPQSAAVAPVEAADAADPKLERREAYLGQRSGDVVGRGRSTSPMKRNVR